MGIDYYLIDEERRELFILGRGDWSKVFEFAPTPSVIALASFIKSIAGHEHEYEWPFEKLSTFISERERVQLVSDAVEGSRGPVPYKIVGSRYTSDYEDDAYHSVGNPMNLWFWDDERDGWHWPKPEKHKCPACGKMTRDTTAGCDHCDLEDK